MKIKIVYFAYLVPNKWESIIMEQLNMLKLLELYNIADINMSVISMNTEDLELLKILLNKHFNKVNLINIYHENLYEYPGFKTIYEIAENDDNTLILYFHSKGMTSHEHDYRIKLFNYTIKNYNEYINEFINNKDLEVGCLAPSKDGFAYFNFFWVRSSYVYNYCSRPENTPEYIKHERYTWEIWLGTSYSKKQKIITFSPVIKYNTLKINLEATDLINNIDMEHFLNIRIDNTFNYYIFLFLFAFFIYIFYFLTDFKLTK
jgi:hypothetical protein